MFKWFWTIFSLGAPALFEAGHFELDLVGVDNLAELKITF